LFKNSFLFWRWRFPIKFCSKTIKKWISKYITKNIFKIKSMGKIIPIKSLIVKLCSTIIIIILFLFRVRQNLICLSYFFEFLFSLLVAWIFIGMILHSKFTILLLNLIRSRLFAHSQYVVIILFRHNSILRLLMFHYWKCLS